MWNNILRLEKLSKSTLGLGNVKRLKAVAVLQEALDAAEPGKASHLHRLCFRALGGSLQES